MKTLLRMLVPVWVLPLLASPAVACPLCESETGRQVGEGIFDDNFGKNVVLTLLPFPILVGIVALLYYGPPKVGRPRRDATDHSGPATPPAAVEQPTPSRHRGGPPCRPRRT